MNYIFSKIQWLRSMLPWLILIIESGRKESIKPKLGQ